MKPERKLEEIDYNRLLECCNEVDRVLAEHYPREKRPSYKHQLRMGYASTLRSASALIRVADKAQISVETLIAQLVPMFGKVRGKATLAKMVEPEVLKSAITKCKKLPPAVKGAPHSKEREILLTMLGGADDAMRCADMWLRSGGVNPQDVIWYFVMRRHKFLPEILLTIPTIRFLVKENRLTLVTDASSSDMDVRIKLANDKLVMHTTWVAWKAQVDYWEAALNA